MQVVEKLIRGLAMEDSRNMFALFEHNNTIDKAVESRVLVADVLAKFERYVSTTYYILTDGMYCCHISSNKPTILESQGKNPKSSEGPDDREATQNAIN